MALSSFPHPGRETILPHTWDWCLQGSCRAPPAGVLWYHWVWFFTLEVNGGCRKFPEHLVTFKYLKKKNRFFFL